MIVTDALDYDCHSVRDFLVLVGAIREQGVRDPLRALEDCLIDLCLGHPQVVDAP